LVAIVSCVSGVEDWIDRLEMERELGLDKSRGDGNSHYGSMGAGIFNYM